MTWLGHRSDAAVTVPIGKKVDAGGASTTAGDGGGRVSTQRDRARARQDRAGRARPREFAQHSIATGDAKAEGPMINGVAMVPLVLAAASPYGRYTRRGAEAPA
jgi:hypothetical protein